MMKIMADVSAVCLRLSSDTAPAQRPLGKPDQQHGDGADGGPLGRREHAAVDAADHRQRDEQRRPDAEQRLAAVGGRHRGRRRQSGRRRTVQAIASVVEQRRP